ncbi:MAG: hypothetical protein RI907_3738 [Pseudomonadota bacterium]|jgi:high-affinity nickel-transport protein
MMDPATLPTELPALAAVALVLGMRHGFDADHLAAIDGLTRSCSADQPKLARTTGALFSLGHGAVVVAVAMAVSALPGAWQVPTWLATTGAWVSILTLLALGALNGWALWSARSAAPHHGHAHLVGWRQALASRLFSRLLRARRPGSVALLGALFALSFDTISQAALFAVASSRLGGWAPSLVLALTFTLGMLLTDGVNGAVVARLVSRADAAAHRASRAMGAAVVATSLTMGLAGLACLLSPVADAWFDRLDWGPSLWVLATVLTGFLASLVFERPAPAAT